MKHFWHAVAFPISMSSWTSLIVVIKTQEALWLLIREKSVKSENLKFSQYDTCSLKGLEFTSKYILFNCHG